MGFTFKVAACSPYLYITDISCVHYRLRGGSITGCQLSAQEIRRKKDGWEVLQDAIAFIRQRYSKNIAERYIEQIYAKPSLNSYFEKSVLGVLKVVWIPHSKKISLFGLHLYREKVKKNGTKVYKVLGIPVWKNRHPFA